MIFFTADTHFGHENVIWMCERPYRDIDEMNEAMIDMYDISVMVTKQSGIAGGFPEKVKAAQDKNILLFYNQYHYI